MTIQVEIAVRISPQNDDQEIVELFQAIPIEIVQRIGNGYLPKREDKEAGRAVPPAVMESFVSCAKPRPIPIPTYRPRAAAHFTKRHLIV